MGLIYKKMAPYLAIAVFFVALDRFFKILAHDFLFGREISLVGDLLKFNLAKNYYIAFSLPVTGWILNVFIVLVIVAVIGFMFHLFKHERNIESGLLSFVVLGSASNLFDRLKFGYVIDYLDLEYFTVFNLADSMIVVSVILLIIWQMKKGDESRP